MGDYLTYRPNGVAIHRLRENTHTRYATCLRLHLIPGLGTKKIARLTAKDVRTLLDRLRTTCQCCAQGLATERKRRCEIGECRQERLSPLTVMYVHSGAHAGVGTHTPSAQPTCPATSPATSEHHRTTPEALPATHCRRGTPVPASGPRRPAPRAVRTRPAPNRNGFAPLRSRLRSGGT
ncbi:hypothetical protein [Streptomyces virginiae]|uniref:hypothetical protein n=1 Tax=Streptomyces virginiae TaxID=1961 RepID=UPI00386DCE59